MNRRHWILMNRRHWILLFGFFLTSSVCADADAGCCDWLFGRANTPYVAGYAPYGVYRVGLNAPYVANPYAAGYPPVVVATAPVSGTYQAQMNSYNNPSVYSGRPVMGNQGLSQTSYSLPITGAATAPATGTQIYGANYGAANSFARVPATVPLVGRYRAPPATTSNPIYGTGNVYPTDVYRTNYPAVAPIPTGLPPSAMPATQVAPVFPSQPQASVGGLTRFFGSSLGTNYRSSYYSAPVTYYRPVTSIDPVSGTTVTMQQPCTSNVQQLQRTPYGSLQHGVTAPTVAPPSGANCGSGCQTTYPGYAAAPTSSFPSTISPYSAQPISPAVQQVGGFTSPSDRSTVPIPSTQQPGYYQQPGGALNTSPLTGAAPNDQAPVDQPRLESARPTVDTPWWRQGDTNQSDDSNAQDSTEPSSYMTEVVPGDRTASNVPGNAEPVQQVQALSDARPIAAPQGFSNPFDQRDAKPTTPVKSQNLVAPPLPPPSVAPAYEPESYSASVQISTPVREAKLRTSPIQSAAVDTKPAPPKRDNTWYSSK